MTEVPHYNVVFATPGPMFYPGYVNSILMTVYALERAGLTWFFLNEASSHVAIAREATIAGQANWSSGEVKTVRDGEFTYDKLMLIDNDIQWSPQDFSKLYHSERDIISGCYLFPDRTTPIYMNSVAPMMREEDLLRYTEPFEVQGVGLGFTCVKAGVFEAIERPWFQFLNAEDVVGIRVILGEDIAWCMKAKMAGFDIWVDPTVRLTHTKVGKVAW